MAPIDARLEPGRVLEQGPQLRDERVGCPGSKAAPAEVVEREASDTLRSDHPAKARPAEADGRAPARHGLQQCATDTDDDTRASEHGLDVLDVPQPLERSVPHPLQRSAITGDRERDPGGRKPSRGLREDEGEARERAIEAGQQHDSRTLGQRGPGERGEVEPARDDVRAVRVGPARDGVGQEPAGNGAHVPAAKALARGEGAKQRVQDRSMREGAREPRQEVAAELKRVHYVGLLGTQHAHEAMDIVRPQLLQSPVERMSRRQMKPAHRPREGGNEGALGAGDAYRDSAGDERAEKLQERALTASPAMAVGREQQDLHGTGTTHGPARNHSSKRTGPWVSPSARRTTSV